MKTKIVIFISLIVSLFTLTGCAKTEVQKENYKIVTSFYPMYIIARNITDGANNVKLVNMTEQNTGCIHDYTLTTNDMKKIENADIFIQNGLGLEIFMDKIFTIYPNLKVLDASINIKNVIKEDEVNPHVWTSIENYINQVKEIISYLTKNSSNSSYIQEGFKPLIPENTKIIDLNLDDGTLTINFTKELINIDKENEEDMLEAIIYSILEIKEIKNIKINIEGNPLVYLPNSKIKLPDTFDKTYGINKLYNIDSYKNTTKTTIYYLSKHNDLYYYVPITKIENSDKEKIEIIIKELKSTPIYHTNLISYLASSTNLTNYEILENNIKLSFNNNLIANINNNEMTETVKYSIALSIRDTYGYSDISFKILDNPEINITI